MRRPHQPAPGGELGSPPTSGSAIRKPVNTYAIGPLTLAQVFQPAKLANVADWQAVLDAVEVALARR